MKSNAQYGRNLKPVAILFGAILASSLTGCGVSRDYFGAYALNQPVAPSCSSILNTTTANLRILFMVDNSGSTGGSNGTDPDYHYRVETIANFLQEYAAKTNFSYGFGFFQTDAAWAYDFSSSQFFAGADQNSSGQATLGAQPSMPFSSNPAAVCVSDGSGGCSSGALAAYVSGFPSKGDTPYNSAFAELQAMVSADVAANGSNYLYSVIFMSDGMPNPSRTVAQLDALVSGLLNAANGNLTVSTVYFGPESSTGAETNLMDMAKTGNGQYVDTNTPGYNLTIDDIVTVPGQTCTGGTGSS